MIRGSKGCLAGRPNLTIILLKPIDHYAIECFEVGVYYSKDGHQERYDQYYSLANLDCKSHFWNYNDITHVDSLYCEAK